MKISARNHWTGTIKHMVKGPVTTEVTIAVAGGVEVVATISTHSAEALGLAVGKAAHALVKASSVIVGTE
jgi:molybdopterin-binding protein